MVRGEKLPITFTCGTHPLDFVAATMRHPGDELALVATLRGSDVLAFAMELVPRISRAQGMDALSSQSNVAGYRAALLGAEHMGRFYPMLMTAADPDRVRGLPVHIVHGTQDWMFPPEMAQGAERALRQAGADVTRDEPDSWRRNVTTLTAQGVRFGRVRIVEPDTVIEVAFDQMQRSDRHESGYAMRFPRIVRLRPDKPVSVSGRAPNARKPPIAKTG